MKKNVVFFCLYSLILCGCESAGYVYIRLDEFSSFSLTEGTPIYSDDALIGTAGSLVADGDEIYIECTFTGLEALKGDYIEIRQSSGFNSSIHLSENLSEINYGDTISGRMKGGSLDSSYYHGVELVNSELEKLN